MRVLITTDTIGGVWTFTQELSIGLLERGCAVALFSLGRLPDEHKRRWSQQMQRLWGSSFCFQSTDIPLEWMRENSRSYVEAEPLLVRLADEFRADVLHCNQFCFGALPVTALKVVTAHSDVFSWSKSCADAPLENSRWLQQYRSLVCKGLDEADALVAPTRWMLDAIGDTFALPKERHVVANGRNVDCVLQAPRKLQAVTAGRLWDEAKDINMLRNVESSMPLLVAGESRCEELRAPQHLGAATLLGSLTQEDVLRLFQESAVYICSSRYEPFGLAPLEAALCGCAILARDLPSLREVWHEGALYFEDAKMLAQQLDELFANGTLLASLQERSRRQAHNYSRAAMTSTYLSLFQSLLRRDRGLIHVA